MPQAQCFLLLAASGVSQSCFALPVKYFRSWRWEHTWIAQAVTTNILLPLIWAAFLPLEFWREASTKAPGELLALVAWGILWGAGGIAYGLVLTRLGASFAYSFVFGISTLAGALAPLAFHAVHAPHHPARFACGVALAILSTLICGAAGRAGIENNATPGVTIPFRLRSYRHALLLGVIAGLCSAAYGLAFTLHFDGIERLVARGVSASSASIVVNLPVYLGSGGAASAFAGSLLIRSRSMTYLFHAEPGRNWILALIMAVFGVGGTFLYSVASSGPGHPTPNASYGVFMSFFVLGGNLVALATGELRSRSAGANGILACGIAGLIAGALLLHSS